MNRRLSVVAILFTKILQNLLGILRIKMIAVLEGAQAVGVLGQLFTFQIAQERLLKFGLDGVLINKMNSLGENREHAIRSIFLMILALTTFFTALAYLFIHEIGLLFFDTPEYNDLVAWVILLGPVYMLYRFLYALDQAERHFRRLATRQSTILSVSIATLVPLILLFGLRGAVYNFLIWYAIGVLIFCKQRFYLLRYQRDDFRYLRLNWPSLLSDGTTILTRNLALFASLALFRILFIQYLDLEQAGYFQAVWSITNYLELFIQGFVIFFHPVLAAITGSEAVRGEINQNFRLLLSLVFPFFIIIAVFPNIFLTLLYTVEYEAYSEFLQWMLVGKLFDVVYSFGLIVALARNQLRVYAFAELIKGAMLLSAAYLMIPAYGLAGGVGGVVITRFLAALFVCSVLMLNPVSRLNRASLWLLAKVVLGTIIVISIPGLDWPYEMVRYVMIAIVLLTVVKPAKYLATIKDLVSEIAKAGSR